jgi:hypothetical protein
MVKVIAIFPCMSMTSTWITWDFCGELHVVTEVGPYNTTKSPSKISFGFSMHISNVEHGSGLSMA